MLDGTPDEFLHSYPKGLYRDREKAWSGNSSIVADGLVNSTSVFSTQLLSAAEDFNTARNSNDGTGQTRPMTDDEHEQFREENREIREFLAEKLGKDVSEYATETRLRP